MCSLTGDAPCYYVSGIADPATGTGGTFFFSALELADIVQTRALHGVGVWLEHGGVTKEVLGQVVHAHMHATTGLHVVMAFAKNSARSRLVYELIRNGVYRGISLGYNAHLDHNMSVDRKIISEISIVNKPYHDTCWVYSVTDTPPLPLQEPLSGVIACSAGALLGSQIAASESERTQALATKSFRTLFANLQTRLPLP